MKHFFTAYWRTMKEYPSILAKVFIVNILLATLWVAEPLYGLYAVDEILKLTTGETVDLFRVFGYWIAIYIAVSVTQGMGFATGWEMNRTLMTKLREVYYHHLLNLDIKYHVRAKTGEMMKKLDNGADEVRELSRQIFMELMRAVLASIIFFVIGFFVSWKLTLIAICALPLYICLVLLTVRITKGGMENINRLFVQSLGRGYDSLANIFTVKSAGAEKRELSMLKAAHDEAIKDLEAATLPWAMVQGVGFFMLLRILLIGIGLVLYTKGELSLGSVFFFQFGFFRMITPFQMLSDMVPYWNEKFGKVRLAEELLEKEISIQSKSDATTLENPKGEIELRDLSFSYEEGMDALSALNLEVSPGEHIALVGHSGAGKSTMAMLLNRFYDPTSGSISIDGVDLKNLDLQWWRRSIGLVLQENIMFNDSVMNNIRYSRPEANDEDVREAAKRAHIHDFIEKLPEKYETQIGERGIRLSGGERQRVAIARAILKNPHIVVLDEATSALDSLTEAAVQEGIRELMTDRTSFIIAHRLSTVRSVDRIAVLDKGKLIACAPHEELMKTCSVYKEMVELQQFGLLAE